MNSTKLVAVSIGALLASTALASATVLTQTVSYGFEATNWGTGNSTSSKFTPTKALTLAGFDAVEAANHITGATLKGVTIEVVNSLEGTLTLNNTASSSATIAGKLSNEAKVTVPGKSKATTISIASNVVSHKVAKKSSYGPVAEAASTKSTFTVSSNLSQYLNAWSALVGELGSLSVTQGAGNGNISFTDQGKISLTAVYSYTGGTTVNTPEPMSLAMLGTGLFGLGVMRRRRRA